MQGIGRACANRVYQAVFQQRAKSGLGTRLGSVANQAVVSFPDPFCACARNLKLGGGERRGKANGNGRNAGAVRMECTLHLADSVIQCSSHVTEKANPGKLSVTH